uniref:Uncharacterized protein n=1 Tax=Cucumis melo TaxID=3656 RepID=A0A9I9D1F6_CUCME
MLKYQKESYRSKKAEKPENHEEEQRSTRRSTTERCSSNVRAMFDDVGVTFDDVRLKKNINQAEEERSERQRRNDLDQFEEEQRSTTKQHSTDDVRKTKRQSTSSQQHMRRK